MIATEVIATIQAGQFSSTELNEIQAAISRKYEEALRAESFLNPVKAGEDAIIGPRIRPTYLRGLTVYVVEVRGESALVNCPKDKKFHDWSGKSALVPCLHLTPIGKQLTLGANQ